MATKATAEQPVNASANDPSLTQPTAPEADSRNVDPPNTIVNGSAEDIEHKQIADIVDELVNSAEASVSGGSDTEASKADPTKALGDKGHVRTSSTVKKPQSFKSVSVNRTFLASKATGASASRQETTAASPSTTPQPTVNSSASRLKLVAKSGSNLGGSTKTLGGSGKTTPGPDASSVWNKNRPPPPTEQKKLSDEQLKDRGIHMAARLGPEDLKGQSNWADIEDDEEWVPDTITWTDGTKITLPQADEIVPSPPIAPASVAKDKPKSPAPLPDANVSPLVKPGVLASGKGLVLKGAPEKPTLVAKPPAPPTPVKSPWATLPPVEKVSPLAMDLPNQAQPPRYPLRDASNTKSTPTPPPAKEIAADDFSRSPWRDNSNRELFNSQSGRYEPVSDRRGSRNDIPSRQPAVLQRPIHHEQQGPAEPSAAFQTSRSSAQEGPYGRRRGSSNVSGGSGNFIPRMAGKPHDMVIPQPEHSAGLAHGTPIPAAADAESPASSRAFSPSSTLPGTKAQAVHSPMPPLAAIQPQNQPVMQAPPPEMPPTDEPLRDVNLENEQKEFMKKRREEAIRRRLEEEQREEQARKARLAEKLKALGPAPERKSAKKEAGKDAVPSYVMQRTGIPASLAARSNTEPNEPVEADSSNSLAPLDAAGVPSKPADAANNGSAIVSGPKNDTRTSDGERQPSFSTNTKVHSPPTQPAAHGQATAPWPEANPPAERYQPWPRGSPAAPKNVWGAPGNDRSLGNGTFSAGIGPLQGSQPAPVANPSQKPNPIGPPRSAQPNRMAPIGPPRVQNAWNNFDAKADDARRRDERRQEMEARQARGENVLPPVIKDKWHAVGLNHDGMRFSNEERRPLEHGGPARNERDARQREEPEATRLQHSHPTGAVPTVTATPGSTTQPRGGSRFFPTSKDDSTRDGPSEQGSRTKSPTPPPPTADGHPVYDGDATRPHVALPPQKPRVKLPPSSQPAAPRPLAPVNKPNSYSAAAAAPLQRGPMPPVGARPSSRGKPYNGISQKPQEMMSQENWQEKINSLMGKKATSPAKSIPVDSSSIPSLELHPYDSATVSMPCLSPSYTDSTEDSCFTSRGMAEECFGEQEMGSLPAVHLPLDAPEAAWQPVTPNWSNIPMKLRVEALASEAYKIPYDYVEGRSVIRILTPGMTDIKTVQAPIFNPRSASNPRRQGHRGSGSRRVSRGGQRASRDSSDHAGDRVSSHGGRSMSNRGGRGFRPRPDNWGRHASSASTAQT
ncbi:hypothetical protein GGR56DRAFT_164952 [Xylariaceae sp. FL0804]|nr:hypothetical protein GGR56DRAFT_164952 [Xylariaceae sp. FL0804]